jgi:hypothetical protein
MNLIRRIAFRLKPITDARHREFFMQRLVKDVPARERRADATASRLPPIPGEGRARAASGAHALKQQGFVAIPDLIKTEWLPAMRSYFSEHACSDPYRPERGTFRAEVAPAGTHVAYFSHDVVARAPHAFEIANDAGVLGIVAEMLGAKPTISYMMAWWSLPAGEAAQHAEKFHRDLDDWRFAKLFCYLTDVDEGSGPHVFVRGSHAVNKLTRLRRFSDEEVESAFGRDSVVRFTGPAGTCFLENTYGMHRGIPPTRAPRLMFQVLYSLRPNIYGPAAPLIKAGTPGIPPRVDAYVNRIYLS